MIKKEVLEELRLKGFSDTEVKTVLSCIVKGGVLLNADFVIAPKTFGPGYENSTAVSFIYRYERKKYRSVIKLRQSKNRKTVDKLLGR